MSSKIKYNFALANLVPRITSQCHAELDKSEEMPKGFYPTPDHVWCGRGKKCFDHNQAFRALVGTRLEEYSAAPSKPEKSRIVTSVFDEVNKRGGFVRQDSKTKLWYSVPEVMAREKISQAFRDYLTIQYKSSKDCRQKKRKQARMKLQTMELRWEDNLASKKLRSCGPSTNLTTSDALKELLNFSQSIAKNSFGPEVSTRNDTRVNLIGLEIPIETPSLQHIACSTSMVNRRGSSSDMSLLSFGDISEEFFPTSLSAA